jgi:hypothetical protein
MLFTVSATELRNRWIDGATPVDARKKPKSAATIAGPAFIEPPRIITTRMIAKSSTTDSEMATTDHTLASSLLAPPTAVVPRAPGLSTIVPSTCPGVGRHDT